mgnify:CR=1 FL=1
MIEQNTLDSQFDEKDIEQIFGGESVLTPIGVDEDERLRSRTEEQRTIASDNLT